MKAGVRWAISIVLFGGALYLAARIQADWDAHVHRAIAEAVGVLVLSAPLIVRLRWRSSD